jgi:ferredoxin-NADP reductase
VARAALLERLRGRGPGAWRTATVREVVEENAHARTLVLDVPGWPGHRAGQHVDIRRIAPDGHVARRSFSIGSAPEDREVIELTIERLERGAVSPFFHEAARVGDTVELRGPLGGHFTWSVADGGPLLLVAGGSGVVPLMSMLRHRRARGSRVPALLFYSARAWDEVIFRDELLAMHEASDGFELAFAITREPPRRPLDFSRRLDLPIVAEMLERLPAPPRLAFICGSNPFVEAAAEGLVEAGLPAATIRTERYGGGRPPASSRAASP